MILNQMPKQNVVNNAISSTTLRISEDAKDQALLVDLQISKLYQNKVRSVIREYISNAKDANIAAGRDVPVKITLPSPDHLFFEVSDSGFGLSPEEIDKYFCSIGASSKRDTNTQIGSYGLGLKCGFAYIKEHGYQFNITTISNGVKYFYVAHYDEQNFPRVSLISSHETDEVGTTICIPVRFDDIKHFISNATDLLLFWKEYLKFEVVGNEIPDLKIGDVFHDCPEFTIYKYNKDLKISLFNPAIVSIDGLPYPVRYNTYGFVVVAKIGIGVLDLIPSREALEETINNKNTIQPIFEKAENVIVDYYQNFVNSFSSEFELWEYVESLDKFDNDVMKWNYHVVPKLKFAGNEIDWKEFSKYIRFRDDWYVRCDEINYKAKPILYVHSHKVCIDYKKLARVEELREGFRVVAFNDSAECSDSWRQNPNYYVSWSKFAQNLREQFLAKSVDYSTIKKLRPKREQTSEPTAWVLENCRFVPVFDEIDELEGTWFVGSKMKPTNENVMNVLTKDEADWSSQIVKSKIYMIPKRNEKDAKENENLRDIVEEAKSNLLKSESIKAIHTDLICELFGCDVANFLYKHQTEINDKVLVDFLNRGDYYTDKDYPSLNGYRSGEHLKFYKNIFGKSYESPEVLYVQEKYELCSGFKNSAGGSVLKLVNFIGGVK